MNSYETADSAALLAHAQIALLVPTQTAQMGCKAMPSNERYSEEIVTELEKEMLEVLQAVVRKGCSCSSNVNPDWHAPSCVIPLVKAVISKAQQLEGDLKMAKFGICPHGVMMQDGILIGYCDACKPRVYRHIQYGFCSIHGLGVCPKDCPAIVLERDFGVSWYSGAILREKTQQRGF